MKQSTYWVCGKWISRAQS